MNSTATLYFANASDSDSHFVRKIDENVIIHIDRYSNSVSQLYFSDEDNTRIPIPAKLLIITKDHATSTRTVAEPIRDIYALCFTEEYEVLYEGTAVLSMKPLRGWNITSE
jgi:hypothetical protein